MSDIKARYVGHPDGAEITVPVGPAGETRNIYVAHGGELPHEIDGLKVPASFRDGLLEQKDNWTEVKRTIGDETKGSRTAAKEADR